MRNLIINLTALFTIDLFVGTIFNVGHMFLASFAVAALLMGLYTTITDKVKVGEK